MLNHYSRSYGKYTAWVLGTQSPYGRTRMIVFPLTGSVRLKSGDSIVEGNHLADVCPQPAVPDPLDEFTQLSVVWYDDEVDSQATRGPRFSRAGNGHQRSSCANQSRRPFRDVATEDIENEIDFTDVFRGVVIEVDELLSPKSRAV
jgi:hypothetical protein